MDGLEKYQATLLDLVLAELLGEDDIIRMASARIIADAFFEITPIQEPYRKYSRNEIFLANILRHSVEVSNTIEHLKDCEVYIRRFPFNKTRVNEIRYLEHCMMGFYSEIAILRNRISKQIRYIEKNINIHEGQSTTPNILREFRKSINEIMRYLTDIRNYHIHEYRYSDDDTRRLETLDTLIRGGLENKLSKVYNRRFREIRRKWLKIIFERNGEIQTIVDEVFNRLYVVVFNDKGKLRHYFSTD